MNPMVRHYNVNGIVGSPLRHVAACAIFAGRVVPGGNQTIDSVRVTIAAGLRIDCGLPAMLGGMRAVASDACQFPSTGQETSRLAKPIGPTSDVELVVKTSPGRMIE